MSTPKHEYTCADASKPPHTYLLYPFIYICIVYTYTYVCMCIGNIMAKVSALKKFYYYRELVLCNSISKLFAIECVCVAIYYLSMVDIKLIFFSFFFLCALIHLSQYVAFVVAFACVDQFFMCNIRAWDKCFYAWMALNLIFYVLFRKSSKWIVGINSKYH